MTKDEIRAKVDEIAKWSKLAAECKQELEKLKGEFSKLGEDELENTKLKQVEFWGTGPAKVVVTHSETVKVFSHTYLAQTLKQLLNDFAKEKFTYDYTEPFKRILAAICQKNYGKESLNDVIAQMAEDEKSRNVLKKKLKGHWEKDVKTLMGLTGMPREEAEHDIYFVHEAMNWDKIVQLLESAGYPKDTPEFKKALDAIEQAVIVEEGVKVGIEFPDSEVV